MTFVGGGGSPPAFFDSTSLTMITLPEKDSTFEKYDEPRLHVERLLKSKLIDFDLPFRLVCLLDRHGVRTLGDLVSRGRDVAEIPQLGIKGQALIRDFLRRMRLDK